VHRETDTGLWPLTILFLLFPAGWGAVSPFSPERSRRNRFGFASVSIVIGLLPNRLRHPLSTRG